MTTLPSTNLGAWAIHNLERCVAYGNYVYTTFVEGTVDAYTSKIARYDTSTAQVSTATICTFTDLHESPYICLDPTDNKLVAIKGGWQEHRATVQKAATAYGIDFGAASEMPFTPVGQQVYAQFEIFSDGTLLMFGHAENSRVGGAGVITNPSGDPTTVDCYLYRLAAGTARTPAQLAGGTWTKLISAPTVYATRNSAVYWGEPKVAVSGRIGISFNVYEVQAGWTYADLSSADLGCAYIYSDDKGQTWRKANGAALTLPITTATKTDATLWVTTQACGRAADFTFDDDENPVIVTSMNTLTAGTSNVDVAHTGCSVWSYAAGWVEHVIDSDTDGQQTDLNCPPCIERLSNGDYLVVSNRDDAGASAFQDRIYLDRSSDLTTWKSSLLTGTADTTDDTIPRTCVSGDVLYVTYQRGTWYTQQTGVEFQVVPFWFYFDVAPNSITSFRFDVTPKFEYPNIGWTERRGSNALWGERAAGATTWTLRR